MDTVKSKGAGVKASRKDNQTMKEKDGIKYVELGEILYFPDWFGAASAAAHPFFQKRIEGFCPLVAGPCHGGDCVLYVNAMPKKFSDDVPEWSYVLGEPKCKLGV
jgi:hypothetical protein